MKRGLHNIVLLAFYCLVLFNISTVASQRLNAPDLAFTYACVKDNFNNFNAIISFEDRIFNSDNVFHLELSDANGNFENARTLKTISNENYSFAFETSFSFPEVVRGENYRLRVRATSPAMVGSSSAAFNAFYVPNVNLVLNDYADVAICGGSSTTLKLNYDVAEVYMWYKNGVFYKQAGASLTITETGEYYAEPYYGECTGSIYSNIVNVSFGESLTAAIEGANDIEVCEGTTYTLKSLLNDEALEYQWFFNGNKINNLPSYMPELTVNVSKETYGSYKLKLINIGGCEASSESVKLRTKQGNATVSAMSPLDNILLEGKPVILKIASSTVDPRISWYRDGQLINNGSTPELEVTQPGTYFARVTAPETCTGVLDSPEFRIVNPSSFTAVIAHTGSYEPCVNTTTTLKLQSLVAVAENGLEVTVPQNLYSTFDLNWKKDGNSINYAQPVLPLASYEKNGSYNLEVTYKNISLTTNTLNVQLGILDNNIVSNTNFICVSNGEAQLSVTQYEGAVYRWYLDEKLIQTGEEAVYTATGAGVYAVETIYKGCAVFSNDFELKPFGDQVVKIFPSQKVFIQTGGSENVYATGADSYEWMDEKGMVVSTSDSFIATEEGTYYLTASKNGCEIKKEVVVAISDVTEVPNIITPNQDNINDKWVLPAQFVNDPDVEVMICDTYGKPVLKTKSYQNNWPMGTEATNYEASIYYYSIQKNGESLKKGSITVVNR